MEAKTQAKHHPQGSSFYFRHWYVLHLAVQATGRKTIHIYMCIYVYMYICIYVSKIYNILISSQWTIPRNRTLEHCPKADVGRTRGEGATVLLPTQMRLQKESAVKRRLHGATLCPCRKPHAQVRRLRTTEPGIMQLLSQVSCASGTHTHTHSHECIEFSRQLLMRVALSRR